MSLNFMPITSLTAVLTYDRAGEEALDKATDRDRPELLYLRVLRSPCTSRPREALLRYPPVSVCMSRFLSDPHVHMLLDMGPIPIHATEGILVSHRPRLSPVSAPRCTPCRGRQLARPTICYVHIGPRSSFLCNSLPDTIDRQERKKKTNMNTDQILPYKT